MSQGTKTIANGSGATVRAAINAVISRLASCGKGTGQPSDIEAGESWLDDNTPSSSLWTKNFYDGADDLGAARVDTTNNRYIPYNAAHGQCRLTKSGANLLLSPFNGNILVINGAPEIVPSAGVTLSTSGLSSSTLYYIYAYMNSGTMTLEASATGHSANSTTGVEVKTGDATRSLVGMARTDGSTAWADSAAQRFVRSWFNRTGITGLASFTGNRTSTATSATEINTEIRCEYLAWASEPVTSAVSGAASRNSTSGTVTSIIYIDGSTAGAPNGGQSSGAADNFFPVGITDIRTLSEGYHYSTLFGSNSSAGTATWYTGTQLAVKLG